MLSLMLPMPTVLLSTPQSPKTEWVEDATRRRR
jgi:hypothetical protein